MKQVHFKASIERLDVTTSGATITLRVTCHGADNATLEALGAIPTLQYLSRVSVTLDADPTGDACACLGYYHAQEE